MSLCKKKYGQMCLKCCIFVMILYRAYVHIIFNVFSNIANCFWKAVYVARCELMAVPARDLLNSNGREQVMPIRPQALQLVAYHGLAMSRSRGWACICLLLIGICVLIEIIVTFECVVILMKTCELLTLLVYING